MSVDLAIIGAGPAGMAAAVEARQAGLSVCLLDEQDAPGGQIWRGVERAGTGLLEILGKDYAHGAAAVDAFRRSGTSYLSETFVWNMTPDRQMNYTGPSGSGELSARSVILATGALERSVPLPGWTLPGVTTAGALQILLKTAGLGAKDAVLVGNGPLLWLIASQMIAGGVAPQALIEMEAPGAGREAIRHLPGALGNRALLAKGVAMMHRVRRASVPIYRNARNVRIEGAEQAERIRFEQRRRAISLPAENIALHNGVIPNQQVMRLLGCDHVWDVVQHAFRPTTDRWGETSIEGVFVAGDGGGIAGARAAELTGRLAARGVARRLGHAPAGGDAPILEALDRELRFRPFIDTLYPALPESGSPDDETIVCRCEEVTAGAIREAAAKGAQGPNQAKAFLRCGMGPCQGRVCGPGVALLIAEERGNGPADAGYYNIRPPLKPQRLGLIAQSKPAEAAE